MSDQPSLFPGLGDAEPALPERIRTMHRLYGEKEGYTCWGCAHLACVRYRAGRYYKCDLTRQSRGPGTDWRVSWPACGRWCEKS